MRKLALWMVVFFVIAAVCQAEPTLPSPKTSDLLKPLGKVKDKIVYESYDGDWDLKIMNADGTDQKNLTDTPDINEAYPQCSPDGKMIAFECCDNTTGAEYRLELMNADGSGRKVIAEHGRQHCWSPDGKKVAYMVPKPGMMYSLNKDFSIYDVTTGKTTRWSDGKESLTWINLKGQEIKLPATDLENMLNLTWSQDGKWVAASIVNRDMMLTEAGKEGGISQSIVAVEVDGNRVVDFLHQGNEVTGGILGCRPTFSDDGKQVTWAVCDVNKLFWIDTATVDFSGSYPKISPDHKHLIRCEVPEEFYHPDWSPDNRFIAFSHGVRGSRMKRALYNPGVVAKGWDICIVDTQDPNKYTQLTTDGKSNKEPDWLKASE